MHTSKPYARFEHQIVALTVPNTRTVVKVDFDISRVFELKPTDCEMVV
jgi:hypothetical protein